MRNENKRFIVFWLIWLVIVLSKDIIMALLDIELWIMMVSGIILGILYWYILFKRGIL